MQQCKTVRPTRSIPGAGLLDGRVHFKCQATPAGISDSSDYRSLLNELMKKAERLVFPVIGISRLFANITWEKLKRGYVTKR
jgi:hypothetical protein